MLAGFSQSRNTGNRKSGNRKRKSKKNDMQNGKATESDALALSFEHPPSTDHELDGGANGRTSPSSVRTEDELEADDTSVEGGSPRFFDPGPSLQIDETGAAAPMDAALFSYAASTYPRMHAAYQVETPYDSGNADSMTM